MFCIMYMVLYIHADDHGLNNFHNSKQNDDIIIIIIVLAIFVHKFGESLVVLDFPQLCSSRSGPSQSHEIEVPDVCPLKAIALKS